MAQGTPENKKLTAEIEAAKVGQQPRPTAKTPAKIINLLGGPGTGKTTTALGLTYRMKLAGLKVKYAQEYAEDMVYEERTNILDDQLYILAKQNRRLLRLVAHTDYIITDSPLFLSIVYSKNGGSENFQRLVRETFNQYTNITFYHPRDLSFDFQQQGRTQQSHAECAEIDAKIEHYMPHDTLELEPGKDYVAQIVEYLRLPVPLPTWPSLVS